MIDEWHKTAPFRLLLWTTADNPVSTRHRCRASRVTSRKPDDWINDVASSNGGVAVNQPHVAVSLSRLPLPLSQAQQHSLFPHINYAQLHSSGGAVERSAGFASGMW